MLPFRSSFVLFYLLPFFMFFFFSPLFFMLPYNLCVLPFVLAFIFRNYSFIQLPHHQFPLLPWFLPGKVFFPSVPWLTFFHLLVSCSLHVTAAADGNSRHLSPDPSVLFCCPVSCHLNGCALVTLLWVLHVSSLALLNLILVRNFLGPSFYLFFLL